MGFSDLCARHMMSRRTNKKSTNKQPAHSIKHRFRSINSESLFTFSFEMLFMAFFAFLLVPSN